METYTVKSGQNIYDVALTLYGSLDGLLDLLLSNPAVNINTSLGCGQKLYYHEDFVINQSIVDWLHQKDIVVKNGDNARMVYNIPSVYSPKMILIQQGVNTTIRFKNKAGKTLTIDWGDYSPLENYVDDSEWIAEHSYNGSGQHKIMLAGDCEFDYLDLTESHCQYYCLETIIADSFSASIENQESNKLIITNETNEDEND